MCALCVLERENILTNMNTVNFALFQNVLNKQPEVTEVCVGVCVHAYDPEPVTLLESKKVCVQLPLQVVMYQHGNVRTLPDLSLTLQTPKHNARSFHFQKVTSSQTEGLFTDFEKCKCESTVLFPFPCF